MDDISDLQLKKKPWEGGLILLSKARGGWMVWYGMPYGIE